MPVSPEHSEISLGQGGPSFSASYAPTAKPRESAFAVGPQEVEKGLEEILEGTHF